MQKKHVATSKAPDVTLELLEEYEKEIVSSDQHVRVGVKELIRASRLAISEKKQVIDRKDLQRFADYFGEIQGRPRDIGFHLIWFLKEQRNV